MIVRYFKTNFSRAQQQWREWRSSLAQRQKLLQRKPTRGRERKIQKLDAQILQSRREFLKSASMASVPVVAVGGGAGVVAYVVLHQPSKFELLAQAYQQHGSEFPFSQDYLENLITDGNLTTKEMETLFERHAGPAQLYSLMAYGLVRKVQTHGLLSARYQTFLQTMREMILNGEIGFEVETERSWYDAAYFEFDRKIRFYPDLIRNSTPIIFEGVILHELVHAYQHQQGRVLVTTLREAESHLVEAEYRFQVDPELLHPARWQTVQQDRTGASLKFLPPRRIIEQILELPQDQAIPEDIIREVRIGYFSLHIFGKVSRQPEFRQVPQLNISDPREIINQLEQGARAIRNDGLRNHFIIREHDENIVEHSYSVPFMVYTKLAYDLVKTLSLRGRHEDAARAADRYFLDAWQRDYESMLDDPLYDTVETQSRID